MNQFVFGLGNPGQKYAFTRHNIGFLTIERVVLELYQQQFSLVSRTQPKLHAKVHRVGDVFFAQPTTYMNDSGSAITEVIQYFDKQLFSDLKSGMPAGTYEQPTVIVIYDDLDIPLGQWKVQFGKGPKVHNGLNSIRAYLNSDLFLHVRIGIDGRQGLRLQTGSDYVLTSFAGEEQQQIDAVMKQVSVELRKRLQ